MEKVRKDLLAWVRAFTHERGRNVSWAEQAITTSANITSREALDLDVIDVVAGDRLDLLQMIDGREVSMADGTQRTLATRNRPVVEVPMTSREQVLHLLTNPQIAYLLLLGGAALFYIEFTNSGMIVPGLLGVLSLLTAFMGLRVLPVSGVGLVLILLSLGLLILDLFVSFGGLLTLGGLVGLTAGSYLLIEIPELRISWPLIGSVVGTLGLIITFIRGYVMRVMKHPVRSGFDLLVGMSGRTSERIDREGYVHVREEYWRALSLEESPLEEGEAIEVIRALPTHLEIRRDRRTHGMSEYRPDS